MSINAARPFTVTGRLECNFKLEDVNRPKRPAAAQNVNSAKLILSCGIV